MVRLHQCEQPATRSIKKQDEKPEVISRNGIDFHAHMLRFGQRPCHVMQRYLGQQNSLARTVYGAIIALRHEACLNALQRALHRQEFTDVGFTKK